MKKFTKIICLLLLLPIIGAAQTPVDATARYMTEVQRLDTVIPVGVLIRSAETPGAVYIGDGSTAGGTRIGDGIGWQEGDALTQDLYTAGHSIHLGDGWEVLSLGGWGAISGGGELSTTNTKFRLSAFGSVFMEAAAAQSSVQITRFAFVPPYMELDTPVGNVQPTIMCASNLIDVTWNNAPIAEVVTNGVTHTFRISPTNFTGYMYFRATIPSGSGSYANFYGELRENGIRVATTDEVASVEARVSSNESAISNLQSAVSNGITGLTISGGADNSVTTNAGILQVTVQTNATVDLSGYLPTNVVTQTVTTNATDIPSGAAMTRELAGKASLVRKLTKSGGTSVSALYDGGSPITLLRHTGGSSMYTTYDVGCGWTNATFRFSIGSTDQTNAAFRYVIYHREPSANPNVWNTLNLTGGSSSLSYFCQTGTIYSVSVYTTNCTEYSVLSFWTKPPEAGGESPTNYIWLLDAVVK